MIGCVNGNRDIHRAKWILHKWKEKKQKQKQNGCNKHEKKSNRNKMVQHRTTNKDANEIYLTANRRTEKWLELHSSFTDIRSISFIYHYYCFTYQCLFENLTNFFVLIIVNFFYIHMQHLSVFVWESVRITWISLQIAHWCVCVCLFVFF